MSSSMFPTAVTMITNKYPLTTIFTPPPSCSSSWTYASYFGSTTTYYQLWQEHDTADPDTACFPTGNVPWNYHNTYQIFSPGVCPYGYTTYSTYPGSEDTTAVCCLENFVYSSTANGVACISSLPPGTVTQVPQATGEKWATVTGPIPMWGEPINIAYNQAQLNRLPSPAASATSTTSETSSNTNPPGRSSETSSGLSDGAKAGVGVGVACGALAIIIALVFFFIRRHRRQRNNITSPPQVQEADSKQYQPPAELEVPRGNMKRQNSPAELGA